MEHNTILKKINNIWEYSKYTGNILFQLYDLESSKIGYTLIPTLCILLEKNLKSVLIEITENKNTTIENIFQLNFNKVIKTLYDNKILTDSEFNFLDNLRNIRNSLFHDFDSYNFYIKDGKAWSILDNETHIEIFNTSFEMSLNIILKCLKYNQ